MMGDGVIAHLRLSWGAASVVGVFVVVAVMLQLASALLLNWRITVKILEPSYHEFKSLLLQVFHLGGNPAS
jgi:hypothetical protein